MAQSGICDTGPGCTVYHNHLERLESRDDVQRISTANQRLSILLCRLFNRHTSLLNEFHKSCPPGDFNISLAIGCD